MHGKAQCRRRVIKKRRVHERIGFGRAAHDRCGLTYPNCFAAQRVRKFKVINIDQNDFAIGWWLRARWKGEGETVRNFRLDPERKQELRSTTVPGSDGFVTLEPLRVLGNEIFAPWRDMEAHEDRPQKIGGGPVATVHKPRVHDHAHQLRTLGVKLLAIQPQIHPG